MTHLLHLDASARRNSISRDLSRRFAEAWRAAHPGGCHTYRDLAADPVPHIGEAWTELCDHVLAHGITDIGRYREAVRTPAQREAWAATRLCPTCATGRPGHGPRPSCASWRRRGDEPAAPGGRRPHPTRAVPVAAAPRHGPPDTVAAGRAFLSAPPAITLPAGFSSD
ncbi:NAD(P)H-dependent oxidoreductase [Streptosporangium sp. NPDC023615]|uniref:NAD(P)H-dependent oxidoreductase n=1 Tax=Streptosporangium sp. NPDC023615 TaxID=3154794 RepID=UPI0034301058